MPQTTKRFPERNSRTELQRTGDPGTERVHRRWHRVHCKPAI